MTDPATARAPRWGGRSAGQAQAAALALRLRGARLEVAIVSTTKGRRWTLPKGRVGAGERPFHAAAREAEEEAGLRGVVDPTPIGCYHVVKREGTCRVDVYLLWVTEERDRWAEDDVRSRRWVELDQARHLLRTEAADWLATTRWPSRIAP